MSHVSLSGDGDPSGSSSSAPQGAFTPTGDPCAITLCPQDMLGSLKDAAGEGQEMGPVPPPPPWPWPRRWRQSGSKQEKQLEIETFSPG